MGSYQSDSFCKLEALLRIEGQLISFLSRIHAIATTTSTSSSAVAQQRFGGRLLNTSSLAAFGSHGGACEPLPSDSTVPGPAKRRKASSLTAVLRRNVLQLRIIDHLLRTGQDVLSPQTSIGNFDVPLHNPSVAAMNSPPSLATMLHGASDSTTLRQLFYLCKPLMMTTLSNRPVPSQIARSPQLPDNDTKTAMASPEAIFTNFGRLCAETHNFRQHLGVTGEGRALMSVELVGAMNPMAWSKEEGNLWKTLFSALSVFHHPQLITDLLIKDINDHFIPTLFKIWNQLFSIANYSQIKHNQWSTPVTLPHRRPFAFKLVFFEKEGVFHECRLRFGHIQDKRSDFFDKLVFSPLLDLVQEDASGQVALFGHASMKDTSFAVPQIIVMLCSRGFPDFATRKLLLVLHQLQSLLFLSAESPTTYASPDNSVMCFVDCNPSGIDILRTLASPPDYAAHQLTITEVQPLDNSEEDNDGTNMALYEQYGEKQAACEKSTLQPTWTLPLLWTSLKPSQILRLMPQYPRLATQMQALTERDQAILNRLSTASHSTLTETLGLPLEVASMLELNGKFELQVLCS